MQCDEQIVWRSDKADELATESADTDDAVLAKLIATNATEVGNKTCAALRYAACFNGELEKLIHRREITEEMKVELEWLFNIRIKECRAHRMMKAVKEKNKRISVRDLT